MGGIVSNNRNLGSQWQFCRQRVLAMFQTILLRHPGMQTDLRSVCTDGVHRASGQMRRAWQGRGSALRALLVAAGVAVLAGCQTSRTHLYENEEFTSGSKYSHNFAGSGTATCEAARRALLSQGYTVTEAKPAHIKASKNFQHDSSNHAEIEFNVVCAADSTGSNTTTAFANAVRALYTLKKSANSASVGVGVLGSLSLPFGLSDDSLVRVGAETISSTRFYDQFFVELERYLGDPEARVEEPAPVAPIPPFLPAVPAAPPAINAP